MLKRLPCHLLLYLSLFVDLVNQSMAMTYEHTMSEKISVMWMVHFNNAQSVSFHGSSFQPTWSQAQTLTLLDVDNCETM